MKKIGKITEFIGYGEKNNELVRSQLVGEEEMKEMAVANATMIRDNDLKLRTNELAWQKIR